MNRPVSPLLHDYKSPATANVKKFRAQHWFVVGLGLPLVGIALLLSLKSASGTDAAPIEQDVGTATIAAATLSPTPSLEAFSGGSSSEPVVEQLPEVTPAPAPIDAGN